MNKNFKLALVPLALAGALASNTAVAGSEACLEIYTGNVGAPGSFQRADGSRSSTVVGVEFNGVLGFDGVYENSTCIVDSARSGATDADLQPLDALGVARELTKSIVVDLNDVPGTANAVVAAGTPADLSVNIVYIPTSPLPGGTKITFKLDNANFNNDQLHLLAFNGITADGETRLIDATINAPLAVAATTDGGTRTVGNSEEFDFVVPSGLTIPAGTRLAMSTRTDDIRPPEIQFDNEECAADPSVALSVPLAANTIGGAGNIIGGETSGSDVLVNAASQFSLFTQHATAEGTVDALAPSLRTQFVADIVDGQLDGASETAVYLRSNFSDGLVEGSGLLLGVALSTGDVVELKPLGKSSVSDNVELQLFDELFENGTSADTFASSLLFTNGLVTSASVDIDNATDPAARTYTISASDLFANSADYVFPTVSGARFGNPTYFALTQTDTDRVIQPSRFSVDFEYGLNFANPDLLDQTGSCSSSLKAFDIDTNGSVLKVPYHFEAGGNWIRVTNEFDQEAVMSMDIQGEVGTDLAPLSFKEGVVLMQRVPPNGSVLLQVSDLVAQAKAVGYAPGGAAGTGEEQRHTITLVVSAPNNQVHGVAVQKVDGNDRVVPVLDLNDWQQ